MPVNLLQLSDLHLFEDPEARLRGVPTQRSLNDVLNHVAELMETCRRVILTGDLAHDELPVTYRILRRTLEERGLLEKCLLLPGNHDNRRGLREVFPEQTDCCEVAAAPVASQGPERPLLFAVAEGGWHLFGLDSHIPGEVCGQVTDEVVDWLADALARFPETPTAVFMHHPPIAVGSPWLDQLGLLEPAPLTRVLRESPQVRLVCCGHIHQDWQGQLGSCQVLSTPSTGLQFTPASAVSSYDELPPGGRLIQLNEDTYATSVVRLPEVHYPPVPEE